MRRPTQLPSLVVYDEVEPCPYLRGRTARMPMSVPLRAMERGELDDLLAAGCRRMGEMYYHLECPACQQCEAFRILVEEHTPARGARRVLARGNRELSMEIGEPTVDAARVELYNLHKRGRDLDPGYGPTTPAAYRSFLVDTCCETIEIRYFHERRLIAVAVADRGETSMSAVYCYFDPRFSRLSPGTYSILKQLELCRLWGLKHLYLGFYIAEPCKMTYKVRFRPHERLIGGRWLRG